VNEELKYVRYYIMKRGHIRYGITSTSATESPNHHPGIGRTSFVDLSPSCKPRKYGTKQQPVNDTLYTYIFGNEGIQGKVNEELKYVRYYIMKRGHIRYGITSTSATESPNRHPGTGRTSFGRGYCRYQTPVYMVLGYLTWYYERMAHLFIEAKERNDDGKLITKYAEKIINQRLEKLLIER
jgi:hypothetical protein